MIPASITVTDVTAVNLLETLGLETPCVPTGARGAERGTLMSVTSPSAITWLSVPDVCERLSLTPGKVHRLVEDRALLGRKEDGVFRIPDIFLDESSPVADLKGTALVLIDGGFSPECALQ